MPYITLPAKPLEGRDASGASYESDTLGNFVAWVDEAMPGDVEITEKQYRAAIAANDAHDAALPAPEPPPARKTREELRAAVEDATTLAQLKVAVLDWIDGR